LNDLLGHLGSVAVRADRGIVGGAGPERTSGTALASVYTIPAGRRGRKLRNSRRFSERCMRRARKRFVVEDSVLNSGSRSAP
jgi:hypothetical protein